MEKRKLFNNYISALKREGIVFTSYSDNYTINIFMGNRTITAYASKNWWRDPFNNVTGNGAMDLVKHVMKQVEVKSVTDSEVEDKAIQLASKIIKGDYDSRSFVGKFFTKKSYIKTMKELLK